MNPELIALIQAKFLRFGSDIWYAWDEGSLLKPLEEMKEGGLAEGNEGRIEKRKERTKKNESRKKEELMVENEEKRKVDDQIEDLEKEMEVFDEEFVRLCGYYSEDGGGLIVESRTFQEELMNNLTVMQSK